MNNMFVLAVGIVEALALGFLLALTDAIVHTKLENWLDNPVIMVRSLTWTAVFYGGAIRCGSDCRSYDVSGCAGQCGDGQIDVSNGEVCDTDAVGTLTCGLLGLPVVDGASLRCNASCSGLEPGSCTTIPLSEAP